LTSILNWKVEYDQDDSVIYLFGCRLDDSPLQPGLGSFRAGQSWRSSKVRQGRRYAPHGRGAPGAAGLYLAAYGNVQRFRRDWWHIFECSSASLTRIYQMRILTCDAGSLLTINTSISETPFETAPSQAGAGLRRQ
jgi:hypothetical protein